MKSLSSYLLSKVYYVEAEYQSKAASGELMMVLLERVKLPPHYKIHTIEVNAATINLPRILWTSKSIPGDVSVQPMIAVTVYMAPPAWNCFRDKQLMWLTGNIKFVHERPSDFELYTTISLPDPVPVDEPLVEKDSPLHGVRGVCVYRGLDHSILVYRHKHVAPLLRLADRLCTQSTDGIQYYSPEIMMARIHQKVFKFDLEFLDTMNRSRALPNFDLEELFNLLLVRICSHKDIVKTNIQFVQAKYYYRNPNERWHLHSTNQERLKELVCLLFSFPDGRRLLDHLFTVICQADEVMLNALHTLLPE